MSDKHYDRVVVRVRKFLTNRLLSRRQMVTPFTELFEQIRKQFCLYIQIVDAVHPNVPSVPKDKMREILAKKYKTDIKNISVFGFKTQFGGGRSTGFAFIYDNEEYLKKYEPKYRLRRVINQFLYKCLLSLYLCCVHLD